MTIKELQRRRRNGASLKILADLAGCTITEIEEALAHSDGSYVVDPLEVGKKVNHTFDTEKAMRLYEQGLTDRGVAERMGLTVQTIWTWRKNEGLPTKHGQHLKRVDGKAIEALYWEGLAPKDIRERLGISKMAYSRWRKERGLPSHLKWDQAEAMELYESGLVDREIGELCGVSGMTIGNWRREQGLPANGRKRALR